MSGGEAIKREEALEIAKLFIGQLKHDEAVLRAEIAGSIRRGKPYVHDIEIVCTPNITVRTQATLTGLSVEKEDNVLHDELTWMIKERIINTDRPRKDTKKNPFGPKYYRINFWWNGIQYPIDLFVVMPPAQWGVIFLIRTGSAEFSHWFVQQGYKYGIRVVDGHLEKNGMTIDTPEEEDVFDAMHVGYVNPEDREFK